MLRVNPNFHGRPRYDYVLVQVDPHNYIFAQLLYVFGITIKATPQHDETSLHMALILPMDETIPVVEGHRPTDKTLRLTRIRSRHRSDAVFINVESVVRGGLLAPVFEEGVQMDEYLIVDVIDEDMWWRMKSVKLIKKAKL